MRRATKQEGTTPTPTYNCIESPSVHLSWLCTSEISRLQLCFSPSAGFPWAYFQQCLDDFVAAICASDMCLVPGVCLQVFTRVHGIWKKQSSSVSLGKYNSKPRNLTTFCIPPLSSPKYPWNCSCSSWRRLLHLKGSGSEQPLYYSQICWAALHPSSLQLLGSH